MRAKTLRLMLSTGRTDIKHESLIPIFGWNCTSASAIRYRYFDYWFTISKACKQVIGMAILAWDGTAVIKHDSLIPIFGQNCTSASAIRYRHSDYWFTK